MDDGFADFKATVKEITHLHNGVFLLGIKQGESISILFVNDQYHEPAYKFESEQEVMDYFKLTSKPLNFYKNGYLWTNSDEICTVVSQAAMVFYYSLQDLYNFQENAALRKILTCVGSILEVKTGDLSHLLNEIMSHAKALSSADRHSIFLKRKNKLHAIVFDGKSKFKPEIQFDINLGIAGHVARSGKPFRSSNIEKNSLFNKSIDQQTGYTTKNILCLPIKTSDGTVVGVGQLINKTKGTSFVKSDEDIATRLIEICGATIQNFLTYQEVLDARNRASLANQLLLFHMNVADKEVQDLTQAAESLLSGNVPSRCLEKFDTFTFLPRQCDEKCLAFIYAICDLKFNETFDIDLKTLSNFVLRVKKGYRDNPYHDWTHAFAVFHFAYLLVKNLHLTTVFDDLTCYSFLIAALCHDLDHRGTNSAFEISSQSPLASLYSSKGSVMERHHFAQTVTLLGIDGCNVFKGTSSEDNQRALDIIQEVILATDLSQHLRIMKDLNQLGERVEKGFDLKTEIRNNAQVRHLIISVLMTSSDLSDQTKNWATTKNTAKNIYDEFFTQGDLEKDMGLEPNIDMDRSKACVPKIQKSFNDFIVCPVYTVLAKLFPETEKVLEKVMLNKHRWNEIYDEWQKLNKSAKESMLVLDEKFDKNVLEKFEKPLNPF